MIYIYIYISLIQELALIIKSNINELSRELLISIQTYIYMYIYVFFYNILAKQPFDTQKSSWNIHCIHSLPGTSWMPASFATTSRTVNCSARYACFACRVWF